MPYFHDSFTMNHIGYFNHLKSKGRYMVFWNISMGIDKSGKDPI